MIQELFDDAYQGIYEILEHSFKGSEIDNIIYLFAEGRWNSKELEAFKEFYACDAFAEYCRATGEEYLKEYYYE